MQQDLARAQGGEAYFSQEFLGISATSCARRVPGLARLPKHLVTALFVVVEWRQFIATAPRPKLEERRNIFRFFFLLVLSAGCINAQWAKTRSEAK